MVYNITNKDYTLVENESGDLADFYGVKLLTGKFKNVILVYGKVSIKEDKANDTAKLSFTYSIQDPAEHDYEYLQKDEDFNNYLGAVLQFIISDSLENNEAQIGIGHNESTTNTHTESPTQ